MQFVNTKVQATDITIERVLNKIKKKKDLKGQCKILEY